MKYVLYILVTVLLPVQLNAQTDSLINALKETASENTIEVDERIAAYNQLTTVYYNIDIKKARAYCKNAEQLAQTDTLSLGMCNVYVNRALLDFSKGFYNGAIENLVKARKILT